MLQVKSLFEKYCQRPAKLDIHTGKGSIINAWTSVTPNGGRCNAIQAWRIISGNSQDYVSIEEAVFLKTTAFAEYVPQPSW